MSEYQNVVASQSPSYFFKADESAWPVLNAGSATISGLTQGPQTFSFNQSGGINNTAYWSNSGNAGYLFSHSDTTSIFNDGIFSISFWVKMGTSMPVGYFTVLDARGSNNGPFIQIRRGSNGSSGVVISGNGSSAETFGLGLASDSWKHFAFTFNGSTWKLYLNGNLNSTFTDKNSINSGNSNVKYWFGGSNNDSFRGSVDEIAVFNSTLSDSQIAAQYNAGMGAKIDATVVTASALLVAPAVRNSSNHLASPLTASAASGNHAVSTYNTYTSLDTYLDGMTLEERLKFNAKTEKTKGTNGSNIQLELYDGAESFYGIGPSGSGALKVGAKTGNGYARIGLIDGISDDDFAIGIWFKLDPTSSSDGIKKYIMATTPRNGNARMDISHVDGEVGFAFKTSSGLNSYTHNGHDYRDGNWHFAAMKYASGNMKYFIDGTQLHSQTVNGTRDAIVGLFFGTPTSLNTGTTDSTYIDIAGFFITSSANAANGTLTAIYNAGNHFVQAGAVINDVTVKFNNALDNLTESLGARADIRFNDTTAGVANFGVDTDYAVLYETTGVTKGISSKNKYAYSYQDPADFTETVFNYIDLESDTATHVVVAKLGAPEAGENHVFAASIGDFDTTLGVLFGYDEYGPWAGMSDNSFDLANVDLIHSNDTSWFGQWAMYTFTKSGSTIKFYINGHLIGTSTTAITSVPFGESIFGGVENYLFGGASTTADILIDEYKVFNYAMTAQQQFEFWQTMQITGWTPAESLMVSPSISAGYGPTYIANEFNVYAELIMPVETDEIIPTIAPMTAFADMGNTNFGTTSNARVYPTALTASALFEIPTFQIGEYNGAEHMDAYAEFPDAKARIPGIWNASPMIATNANFPTPASTFTRGGLWRATALTAKAQFVLPPAYKTLQDDLWYRLLYLQHSQTHGQTGYTAGVSSAYAFLKLFDDVTSDLNGSNTSQLKNNLPWHIVIDKPLDTNNTFTYATASNQFTTAVNTPVLETGYYDEFQRKAVRFNNIAFIIPEDTRSTLNGNYSVEMTIKTTKSNQILMSGEWGSTNYYQVRKGSIGLNDGKLYALTSYITQQALHPKNPTLNSIEGKVFGRKRIDDGFWHHILIQYGYDGRTQFWIDGELDIQMFGDGNNSGANIRPHIIGYNSKEDAYQSDFFTSAYSYDAGHFTPQQDIILHNAASFNYEPIKAEPMTNASATIVEPKVQGNRGRALMLYWWPETTGQGGNLTTARFDEGFSGKYDVPTFDTVLETIDYLQTPPQQYFGWDVFPVDITGYYVSDLVKEEAYGGPENIQISQMGFAGSGANQTTNSFKVNRRGSFRDPITDDRRYIDLVNDIDLSKFDAIFFRNFPDQSVELEEFARNQSVDTYFRTTERGLYEQFIKSVRAAVDTGISLFVTNTQLALDLGIVDRIEEVSDLSDIEVGGVTVGSDPYTPTLLPAEASNLPIFGVAYYRDTYKNNRLRIVNEIPGITDYPTVIATGSALWINDDRINFGGPNRSFARYEFKPNGLSVGDEFIISDNDSNSNKRWQAVPFANVKAGKIVTAFAEKYRKGLDLVDNPFANYATSIALAPGDLLNGKPLGGRIFVQFTETNLAFESNQGQAELIQDFWINFAYDQGVITQERKNQLLNAAYNIDRLYENGALTLDEYNKQKFWSFNGMHVLAQADQEIDIIDSGSKAITAPTTKGKLNKFNRNGQVTSQNVTYSTTQFFTFKYSLQYPTIVLEVPTVNTRGFWWLSDRYVPEGNVNRVQAFTATATNPNAVTVIDKNVTTNAAPMIIAANMPQPTNYKSAGIRIAVIPFQASAMITQWVINQTAQPMLATASLRTNVRAITSSTDEIVLYVHHVDPILYIREEVIR